MILNVALSDNMVSMASNIFWQIRAKYSPEQYCIIKGNDYLIAIYSGVLMPTGREIWTCVFAKKNKNWTLFQHKNNKVKNSRNAYNHFID